MKIPIKQSIVRPIKSVVRLGLPAPLCFMPLSSNLDLFRGVGTATFTRTTAGRYIDPNDGLLKTAADNVPRFETNGLLIEGASTNLLLRSEEFDAGAWVKSNSSITANNTTAPDGNNTSDKLIENTATSTHSVRQGGSVTINESYTGFIFAKPDERNFIRLKLGATFFGNNATIDVDLTDGSSVLGSDADSGTVTELVNGWWLIKLTGTAISTGAPSSALEFFVGESISSFNYTGDGSSGLYIWGAQLEELPFATSYIPTTTTTVTRTADNLSIDAGNIPVPANDYSVSAEVSLIGDGDANTNGRDIFNVNNQDFRLFRARQNGSGVTRFISGSNASADQVQGSPIGENNIVLFTGTSKSGLLSSYNDGVLVAPPVQQGGSPVSAGTKIEIGMRNPGEYLYGHLKNFRTYDVALTAEQVAQL